MIDTNPQCISCINTNLDIDTTGLIKAVDACSGLNGTATYTGPTRSGAAATAAETNTAGSTSSAKPTSGSESGSGAVVVSVGVMGAAMALAAAIGGF